MILKGHFKVKKNTKGKSIEIEGLANALVKDRIGDIIPKDAWMLDNFKKNPIIFLNHDSDTPIGKAIGVEPTDKGLSIKVRLSRSNEGKIPMVRDLVNEGILRSFSVGFDDHGSAEKSAEGDNIIKKAELIETSIVSVPMNQDSLFSVVGADIDGKTFYSRKSMTASVFSNCETYNQMKEAALNEKGAWVAAALHNTIYESADEAKEIDGIYAAMLPDMQKSEVDSILAGNTLPVPERFIELAAAQLNLDIESLKELNKKAEDEDDDSEEKDFQECINSKVPKLIEDGVERDEAIAQAISACETAGKCVATPEMIKAAIVALNAKAADEDEEEDDEDEDEDKKAKATDEEEEDEDEEEDDEKAKALDGDDVPIPLGKESGDADEFKQGQPDIELAKSQLALAGSMVSLQKETLEELRKLTDILSSKATALEEEEAEEEAGKEDGEEEEEKLFGEDDEEEDDDEEEEDKEKMLRIQKDMEDIAKSQRKLNKLLLS